MGKPYKNMSQEEKDLFNSYCVKRWQKRKSDAIEYKGGKCYNCGYDKCDAALEFHHTDPSKKEASWNKMRLWGEQRLKDELDKCVLLCANCHREAHWLNSTAD